MHSTLLTLTYQSLTVHLNTEAFKQRQSRQEGIVFLLVKTEMYFIKADARALPSEGEIVVLMGIQSPGLGVLRVLNTRSHLVSVDRTSLVPSGLFG